MYCSKCGNQIEDDAVFCSTCGSNVGIVQPSTNGTNNINSSNVKPKPEDASSFWWALLGFFIPFLGLILYLVFKDDYPLRSKSCGKGALIAVILEVAGWVLCGIIVLLMFSAGMFYF